jgi:predicted small secreted protein
MKLKAIFSIIMAVMISAVISGCNTMEGIGKDIKKAGESIEGAASK